MARFMYMDAVGGRVWAGFMFGSPSHLGWHPRLAGDFPFVDRRGRPWPFVEGGANGPLWSFVDRGCGRS